jgi:hypothetical protein
VSHESIVKGKSMVEHAGCGTEKWGIVRDTIPAGKGATLALACPQLVRYTRLDVRPVLPAIAELTGTGSVLQAGSETGARASKMGAGYRADTGRIGAGFSPVAYLVLTRLFCVVAPEWQKPRNLSESQCFLRKLARGFEPRTC